MRLIFHIMAIDGKQCRAARAWLRLEMRDLARRVGTTRATLQRFELGKNTPRAHTLDGIRRELERCGIRFTFRSDGRPKGIEDSGEQGNGDE